MLHAFSSATSPFATSAQPLQAGAGQYALRWLTEPATPPLPLAEELYLYQQPAQLQATAGLGYQVLIALLETKEQTAGWWPIHISADGAARSPVAAPFGGPQLLRPDVPTAVLDEWLTRVHEALAANQVTGITLRLPPFALEPGSSGRLVAALQRTGYQVGQAEINHHLPLGRAYETHLQPSERRRLHKCQRHGFQVEQEPPLLLPLAYEFLRRCREEKGQALSLTEEQLTALFRQFPRDYLLFSVRDAAGEWAALTVAVLAGRGTLYNFYPASPLRYNAFSPVVLLNAGLHAFGQASGLRLLDLGTSTLPTGPNESLLRFKRHLGGVPSLKLTLEKKL